MVQKSKAETIKDVDGIAEAILYFFKYILPKNWLKIITFILILGMVVFFTLTGYNCKTKWFEFKKDPVNIKPTGIPQ